MIDSLEELKKQRSIYLKRLWSIFNKMSYKITPKEFTDEDLDVWTAITKHSDIQKSFAEYRDRG
jgi:hypothetical protein